MRGASLSSAGAASSNGSIATVSGGGSGGTISADFAAQRDKLYTFEVTKLRPKMKSNTQKVLEVQPSMRSVSTYNVRKQKRVTYAADNIVKMQRSNVNPRKLKLFWSTKDQPTRYLFESSAQRERFVEAATFAARGAVDGTQRATEVINVWCGTWNMGSAPPPADLSAWMPRGVADLYVVYVGGDIWETDGAVVWETDGAVVIKFGGRGALDGFD